MLQIRKDQLAAMGGARNEPFVARTVAYVREEFPEEYSHMGEPGVRKLVVHALEQGKGYGLTRSTDITGLVSLILVLDLDFQELPQNKWMKDILESPDIEPSEKIGMVLDGLS